MSSNQIFSINGPVVTVRNSKDFSMQEMVYVGERRLVGEVISINDHITTIQVYEVTTADQEGAYEEIYGVDVKKYLG